MDMDWTSSDNVVVDLDKCTCDEVACWVWCGEAMVSVIGTVCWALSIVLFVSNVLMSRSAQIIPK